MPVVNKHVILDPAARAKVKRVLGADWVADQPKTGSQLLQEFAQQDLKGKTEPEKLSPQEKAKLRAKIKKIVKEPPQ
jgi:hypothetical protein